jgi:uncharacterized protein
MTLQRGAPIQYDDLASLALGAGIVGTGGGTHPYLELLNAQKLYRDGHVMRLVDASELDESDLIAEVGYMGAPLASKERLTDPAHAVKPVRIMESFIGRRFTAVMPSEIGTANGMRHVLVAAMLDLPIVDADSRGRGFPEMQMNSFAIGGLPLYPVAMSDVRNNAILITRSESPRWSERLGRPVSTEFGAIAAVCRVPRTAADVRIHGVLGSVSRAIRIGRAIHEAISQHRDPVAELVAATRGLLLFRGKVQDVARRTTAGFLRGAAEIAGSEQFTGSTFRTEFQNEYATAWIDGRLSATVPDLICLLDTVSGEAVGTETIRYGMRVSVALLPAAPVLKTTQGLEIVGPRAFGYDFDYVSPLAGFSLSES